LFEKKKKEYEGSGLSSEEIVFKLKDWMLLDSYRFVNPKGFRFIIETLGVYSNKFILTTSIDIIVDTLQTIENYIEVRQGNIPTEYIIIVNKDDYTIGKLLEMALYAEYFEKLQILKFCGFKKLHPHDAFAHIRLNYNEKITEMYQPYIISQVKESVIPIIETFLYIKSQFQEDV
jgi:DNA-directed RNA polymerase subunit L